MKLFFISIVFFLCQNFVFAQIQHQDYKQTKFAKNNYSYIAQTNLEILTGEIFIKYTSHPIEVPILKIEPFLGISLGYVKKNLNHVTLDVNISTSTDGNVWSGFFKLPDAHNEAELGKNINTDLYFLEKTTKFIKFIASEKITVANSQIDSIQITFISPGIKTTSIANTNTGNLERTDACPCPQPTFRSRVDWGCPVQNPPPSYSYTTVTHLVVHHSAGSNTSSDWDAVMRSIFTLHTQTNGWADVGYNWLIAPNGVLYEGRGGGNNVVGAHFCGTNTKTMGICMLGTYTTATITTAARNMLVDVLAWKCCNSLINPLSSSLHTSSGLTLNHISGHRDGCATDCPGNTTYIDLPALRTAVNDKVNNACTVSAINNLENIKYIKISPNPANTIARVTFNLIKQAQTNLAIIDLDGKIIYQKTLGKIIGTQNVIIPIQKLAKGIYTLKIINNKEIAQTPLLVK